MTVTQKHFRHIKRLGIGAATALALLTYSSSALAFSVQTEKSNYQAGETIKVRFSGFATSKDWISIAYKGESSKDYESYKYTNGAQYGTLSFGGLPEGLYEVRAFCCWQPGRPGNGGYNIKSRYAFTVGRASQDWKVCRSLRSGEPHYSGWSHCCDLDDGRSAWTSRKTGQTSHYGATCSYYGIKGQ